MISGIHVVQIEDSSLYACVSRNSKQGDDQQRKRLLQGRFEQRLWRVGFYQIARIGSALLISDNSTLFIIIIIIIIIITSSSSSSSKRLTRVLNQVCHI